MLIKLLPKEFFSFGTNDLTQINTDPRDDAEGKFILYIWRKRLSVTIPCGIDQEGSLMKIAVEKARSVKPDLLMGICGEHGGEPSSIEFCHMLGLNYVSCSPYRIPVARLAAAQAAINHKK